MTIITQTIINRIHSLYKQEVALREIARRVGVAPSTVFRIIHGQQASNRYHRCPTCGALLITKECRYCKEIQYSAPLVLLKGSSEITLDLKPEHYKRYLKVRKLAEARRERTLQAIFE